MKFNLHILVLSIFFLNYPIKKVDVSGEIVYAFTPNSVSKEDRQGKDELYSAVDRLNASASDLRFILRFNKNESIFLLENQLESDLNQNAISYARNIITKGKYYCNKKENILLRESHSYDKYTLIKSSLSDSKWHITKESKKIGNYVCYKATQVKSKISSSKKKEFVVEAWFCPRIPVSFGPKEYNGLPGLILEIKDPLFTFYATKINLNNTDLKIIPLKSKNIISEEENIRNFKELNKK